MLSLLVVQIDVGNYTIELKNVDKNQTILRVPFGIQYDRTTLVK